MIMSRSGELKMAFRYSAYKTTIFNCPCRCCLTWEECRAMSPSKCQGILDRYVDYYENKKKVTNRIKYSETKKSKAIREKLEKDSNDIEKLILQLSKDGCKNDNNELVFLTSRYSYIKELLKKYWKDGEKNE